MRTPTTPPPPPRLQPFARGGDYLGASERLGELARAEVEASGELDPTLAAHLDLDGVGVDLHLQGVLWTVADQGKVHAFRWSDFGGE